MSRDSFPMGTADEQEPFLTYQGTGSLNTPQIESPFCFVQVVDSVTNATLSREARHWCSPERIRDVCASRISMAARPSNYLVSYESMRGADRRDRLLEFTLSLGSSNAQCSGTSKTDLDRDFKSILLLSSCSNGVHWSIVDRFSMSDILAPDFGFDPTTAQLDARLSVW